MPFCLSSIEGFEGYLPLDLADKIDCGSFYEVVSSALRLKKRHFSSLLGEIDLSPHCS